MNRFLTAAFVALAVVLSSGAASAQVPPGPPTTCVPPTPPGPPTCSPGYPPRPPVVILGGQFQPSGTGALDVGGATPNADYPGIISSHSRIPVSDTADANGVLNYRGFAVPADFETPGTHRVTFTDGSFLTFCVNSSGLVVACGALATPSQTQGNLARTGTDSIELGLRAGLASIGAGALFLLWRRRRVAAI